MKSYGVQADDAPIKEVPDDIKDDFSGLEDEFDELNAGPDEGESEEPPENDTLEIDKYGRGNDGKLYDSYGREVSIEKPMWTSNEKANARNARKKNKKPVDNDGEQPKWVRPAPRMSTASWLITLTLMCIPAIGFICLLVWAFFSDSAPDEKRSFARAQLILSVILVVVILAFGITIGGSKLTFDSVKTGAGQMFDKAGQDMKDSLKDEAQGAVNNYNGLTDDDFTN